MLPYSRLLSLAERMAVRNPCNRPWGLSDFRADMQDLRPARRPRRYRGRYRRGRWLSRTSWAVGR
jgi:hypothetical protein